ncbi:MAG: HPr(Ser) kinase/phosphatase [Clostridiales bacterium]|nr:HPr(Ser) kinase/phosphatase [Clostridiales bacterium]
MYSLPLQEFIDEFSLEVVSGEEFVKDKNITTPELNRPAIQLAGFYEHFDAERPQMIGMVEHSFLSKLEVNFRKETLKKLFSYKEMPCFILSRSLEPFPEMLEYAEESQIPVLVSKDKTTELTGDILNWLKVKLAPRTTVHGVLVDIYGEGVLIMGESGIGKSEAALELVKRGHRLVADDAVEIKKISHDNLTGSCPKLIRYFIEVRGIGIINVKQMFGVQSVMDSSKIDLVIKFEPWEKGKVYDRIGLNEEYIEILDTKIVCHTIPIRPGRNAAVICEAAAVNRRQKKMGYNAAQVLNERIMQNMQNNM